MGTTMNDEQTRQRIDDEIERTLSSLDGLDDIDAGPYFFTRVQQRLADTQSAPGWGLRIRPAYIALILLLNIVTISVTLVSDPGKTSIRTSEVAALAQQYSLGTSGSMIMFDGEQKR